MFFCDLLSPCAVFSKILQQDTLDILGALTSLLRTVQELNKLSSRSLQQWPNYSATLTNITQEGGSNFYQQHILRNLLEAERYYQAHFDEYCTSVTTCFKSRLEWTDIEFVRDVILFLATQGWQKLADEENEAGTGSTPSYTEAIVHLTSKFKVPLESACAVVANVGDELSDLLQYAIQFISLSSTSYQVVWWKLFHSPNASYWTSVLILARLLFTLLVSNGKLERVFSTMKNIKVDKRSSMSNEFLDDLLVINVDKVKIEEFKADHSIDLWWRSKTRRPNQTARKVYKTRKEAQGTSGTSIDSESSDSLSDNDILGEWDHWMDDFCDS